MKWEAITALLEINTATVLKKHIARALFFFQYLISTILEWLKSPTSIIPRVPSTVPLKSLLSPPPPSLCQLQFKTYDKTGRLFSRVFCAFESLYTPAMKLITRVSIEVINLKRDTKQSTSFDRGKSIYLSNS